MGTYFAFFLILFSFYIPLLSGAFPKKPTKRLVTLWAVLSLHHCVSFYNHYIAKVFGADADAVTFHEQAASIAKWGGEIPFGFGSNFYQWILGHLYSLIEPNLLLGQAISTLAFLGATIFLLKLKNLLNFKGGEIPIILLFGLEPTMLLWTSVTLREPFQIFFLLAILFYGTKWRTGGSKNDSFLCIAMFLPFGLLHNGLAVYSPFLLILLLTWNFSPRIMGRWTLSKRRVRWAGCAILLSWGVYLLMMNLPGVGALSAVQASKFLEYAEAYREGANIGGSSYGGVLDLSSPKGLVTSTTTLFVHYFLGPFPWEIRGIIDIPAFLTSVLRLTLVAFAFLRWRHSSGGQRNAIGFLLVVFLTLEFLWAMGTTNYGTAVRHHMVAWGIIVMLGTPDFIAACRKRLLILQGYLRKSRMVLNNNR